MCTSIFPVVQWKLPARSLENLSWSHQAVFLVWSLPHEDVPWRKHTCRRCSRTCRKIILHDLYGTRIRSHEFTNRRLWPCMRHYKDQSTFFNSNEKKNSANFKPKHARTQSRHPLNPLKSWYDVYDVMAGNDKEHRGGVGVVDLRKEKPMLANAAHRSQGLPIMIVHPLMSSICFILIFLIVISMLMFRDATRRWPLWVMKYQCFSSFNLRECWIFLLSNKTIHLYFSKQITHIPQLSQQWQTVLPHQPGNASQTTFPCRATGDRDASGVPL